VIAPPPARPYVDELGADPGRLRIGLLDHHPREDGSLHPDCVTAVQQAAGCLESLGHVVAPGFPAALSDEALTRRFMALWATLAATGIEGYGSMLGRPLLETEVEPLNWAQAEHARKVSGVDYANALTATAEFRRAIQQWWADGWDLLLTPTLGEPPLEIGELQAGNGDPLRGMRRATAFVPFTPPFNVSGQPAINVPLWWNDEGLPIGIQLVAAYGREDVLIRVASQLEQAQPWTDRRPT
jgi:amidase